jgi:hypothetical protein
MGKTSKKEPFVARNSFISLLNCFDSFDQFCHETLIITLWYYRETEGQWKWEWLCSHFSSFINPRLLSNSWHNSNWPLFETYAISCHFSLFLLLSLWFEILT